MALKGSNKTKYQREYMKRKRADTDDGSNIETVPQSYVQGLTGKFKSLPKRDRFLTLSDGQVLDRLNQPEAHASGDFIQRMRACNESYNYRPNKSSKEWVKQLMKATR